MLTKFDNSTFDEHGIMKKDKFKKEISQSNCMFCPYQDRHDLCSRGTPFKKQPSPFEIF